MDAAEPFNVPVNPEALGIPVSINLEWIKIFFWKIYIMFTCV
jgi:hypothetical protein